MPVRSRRQVGKRGIMRGLIIDIGQKKELREILSRDILDYQIERLQVEKMLSDIVVLTDTIEQDYQQGNVSYCACSELPKYEKLKAILDDRPFLLIYGPILNTFPLENLREQFWATQADIVCLSGGCFYGETFGVEIDDLHRLTSAFGTGGPLNNIYIINPLILTYYFHERFEIQTFLAEMLKHHRKIFCLNNTEWLEYINTYPAYFQTTKYLLQQPGLQGTKIHNSFYGKNCEIDFSVELHGRQFFGDDCQAGAASILQNSVFLSGVTVGANSRVSDSILQKHVKIGNNCELDNCLLGENCQIGDNVRLPRGTILAADSVVRTDSGVLNVL